MPTIASDSFTFRLRLARENAGLQQLEVADQLGVYGSTISRWENGFRRVTTDELRNLARVYGVTVGWLMGEAPLI